ncbi:MerR family transcriptional regulator [Mycolicibacterium novocastrense]|uniref:MerR family transcriptional regulator n=1 Tax=Mycolicibacterium novocastrense TaxID=59813 RepID=A0AAW5STI5_MYCNV|nr:MULTISPECIES: MerR family transcriptional regulator [Mycobacterium]MCV7027355.1 MerR family transcriptional regulator [Mycolicibacterium novocastrense]OBB71965.1 MerR family transcriptional regulator [Mycobacterium sp. 852014-52144_SCH5372336]UUO04023.1 MerR family transcriptional regulator [Mycolicibacterium novocastrense]
MAEYRLDELAEISGVSARNIRAYRERGLLDPPRRVGRSAFYDDYHLSQLRTINQLHRRGFNTVHIAEFFTSLREGTDLADILGIQRAVLSPRTEAVAGAEPTADASGIGADSDETRRLVEYGLAEVVDAGVVLTDPAVRQVVARASDHLVAVRALLHIVEGTRGAVDALAAQFVQSLGECMAAQFGADHAPTPDNVDELTQAAREHRDLWTRVVSGRLEEALQRHMPATDSERTPPLTR